MKNEILNIIKIDQNKLSSINQFLAIFKSYSNSLGVILWELNSLTESLFVVADTFENKIHPPLPLHKSVTGNAIKSFESIYVPDIEKEPAINTTTLFWQEMGVKSLFAIPIKFENGNFGAINVYSENIDAFPSDLQNEMINIASILPTWYRALLDRATQALFNQIDVVLKEIESSYIKKSASKDEMIQHFQALCTHISDTFQSLETTIILKDPFKSDVEFECLASTWLNDESKKTYYASIDEGLTGWILYNKMPVYIPDLIHFQDEENKKIIQKQYPGIKWNAIGDFKISVVKERMKKTGVENFSPPIGFIGAPIYIGDELLGVIRCCAALTSPYYFGIRELEILKLIAIRIGEIWYSWIQYTLIREDAKTWEKIIVATNQLDEFVLNELNQLNPKKFNIFEKVLSLIPDLVRDAEIIDVRLFKPETKTLYFASVYGTIWESGTEDERKRRIEKEFPVEGPIANSAGAWVFREQKSLKYDPIEKGTDYYNETFSQTTRMILAPLIIRGNVLGVLDVRSTKNRPFQNTALHAVELMAGQLAIYHELVDAVSEVRNLQNQQIKTFQDFEHQFRSPIYQASIYSKLALYEANDLEDFKDSPLLSHLQATAGLCNKAYRVATNLRLFSDLSKNIPLLVKKTYIRYPTIIKLLIEAALDSKIGINPNKNIEIYVEKDSFSILDEINVLFDTKMLEQVINILIDNAIKYSYNNTKIRVFGEFKRNLFYLVVKNKGIPILEKETTLCRIRGWRSDKAKLVTGEGGGIGLWVLDKIVDAHGGSLIILPTDKDQNTLIKILLSSKRNKK